MKEKEKKQNKFLYKKDPNLIYECEACADHVCNDECGCELSEQAMESLKKMMEDKENE